MYVIRSHFITIRSVIDLKLTHTHTHTHTHSVDGLIVYRRDIQLFTRFGFRFGVGQIMGVQLLLFQVRTIDRYDIIPHTDSIDSPLIFSPLPAPFLFPFHLTVKRRKLSCFSVHTRYRKCAAPKARWQHSTKTLISIWYIPSPYTATAFEVKSEWWND